MKKLFLIMALLLIVGNVYAADGTGLADLLFAPETVPLKLTDFDLTGADKTSAAAGNLNPGKALLLSAIMPGAGEFYAGSKLKAGIFFGIEILAWTGVVYYYGQGKDKEDEFMEFADANFDENLYRVREFDLARSAQYGDSNAYNGDFDTWTDEEWEKKIHYLPREGFTHELPTQADRDANWSHDQQFYEMIGKYIHQFGFGWLDPNVGNITPDDAGTAWFDGNVPMSLEYMDMRHDSNKLLEYSAWGYNIALLNHVASALDASFSVRVAKRKAKVEVGFRQVPYDRELVNAAGLNFTW
ncbi:MAG: hypothetical protein P9X24_05580 [Candidatus Hatepunaea meridiana]|nr:hypothetical protein [Candidatus Hatepunaea meridiana]